MVFHTEPVSNAVQPIESWQAWTELFRASPGQRIELTYERDGKILATAIRPDSVEQSAGVLADE